MNQDLKISALNKIEGLMNKHVDLSRKDKIRALKEVIQDAIEKEAFEYAAILRDKIKELND